MAGLPWHSLQELEFLVENELQEYTECQRCPQVFYSEINYKRHKLEHRSSSLDKKTRGLLAAFWDKLSSEQVMEILSFDDVMLKEIPGSSILSCLASSLRKRGASAVPQVFVKAGTMMLNIIETKPPLPISSRELFSILDDASERTFLCAGTAEVLQSNVFGGETITVCLDLNNLVACTSFLFEKQLVKAWIAHEGQKLLVEEEEAARKRQAEKKTQKRRRQKEQKLKEHLAVNVIAADVATSAEASECPTPSDSRSHAPVSENVDSPVESLQPQGKEPDKDIEEQFDSYSEPANQWDFQDIEAEFDRPESQKVWMQKCAKCSWVFCSQINYKRHALMHRKSSRIDKEFHKNRNLLAAFWDKLSLHQVKEILALDDVMLKEIPGSFIKSNWESSLHELGVLALPEAYVNAGSALLDIIQAKPYRLPISSGELFSILDDASERTFLCAGAAESLQNDVFDGETAEDSVKLENLVASVSFLFEQQLVKAWVADRDAEALRCQMQKQEEAAQERQAILSEKRSKKKLRANEKKAKKQQHEGNADSTVNVVAADRPTSAEASKPSPTPDSSSKAPVLSTDPNSRLEYPSLQRKEPNEGIKAQFDSSVNQGDSSSKTPVLSTDLDSHIKYPPLQRKEPNEDIKAQFDSSIESVNQGDSSSKIPVLSTDLDSHIEYPPLQRKEPNEDVKALFDSSIESVNQGDSGSTTPVLSTDLDSHIEYWPLKRKEPNEDVKARFDSSIESVNQGDSCSKTPVLSTDLDFHIEYPPLQRKEPNEDFKARFDSSIESINQGECGSKTPVLSTDLDSHIEYPPLQRKEPNEDVKARFDSSIESVNQGDSGSKTPVLSIDLDSHIEYPPLQRKEPNEDVKARFDSNKESINQGECGSKTPVLSTDLDSHIEYPPLQRKEPNEDVQARFDSSIESINQGDSRLIPLKVQMQKCEKCSWEFCSPINYRRHVQVHHQSLNVDKNAQESHEKRNSLAAFWDKLSFEQVKQLLKCDNDMLKDIIQAKPSGRPISSQKLFSILDDASERTFLCTDTTEHLQNYVFDEETAKNSLDMKNLFATIGFLFEQKLVKAWVAAKDAEALGSQKPLLEEEEAASVCLLLRQAMALGAEGGKELHENEQEAKEQFCGENADSTVVVVAERPTSAEALEPSDSSSRTPDLPTDKDSSLESLKPSSLNKKNASGKETEANTASPDQTKPIPQEKCPTQNAPHEDCILCSDLDGTRELLRNRWEEVLNEDFVKLVLYDHVKPSGSDPHEGDDHVNAEKQSET